MSDTEMLSCRLSESEKIERAKTTTELLKEHDTKEELQKARAKAAGDELKTIRAKMQEAGRAAREGHEVREVTIDEKPNIATQKMEIYRRDTGELLRTRKMSELEVDRFVQMRLVD